MALKLVLMVLLVLASLFALRFLGLLASRPRQQRAADRTASHQHRVSSEEMQQCRRCGTYVPAIAPYACDRADCPYPARHKTRA